MEQQQLYKDTVARVLDLMRSNYGGKFKAFYEGDPIDIPTAALPCVVVEKLGGSVSVGATGTDDISEQILIKLIYDKRDDIGASDSADMTERKLRLQIEGRDPVTGQYDSSSVLSQLRTNLTLQGDVINSSLSIAYDVNPRPDEVITSEAHITMDIDQRIYIPTRV